MMICAKKYVILFVQMQVFLIRRGSGGNMIINKPTVIIYTRDPDEDLLREICAGIEEEGVLYEVHSGKGDMDTLAYEG